MRCELRGGYVAHEKGRPDWDGHCVLLDLPEIVSDLSACLTPVWVAEQAKYVDLACQRGSACCDSHGA